MNTFLFFGLVILAAIIVVYFLSSLYNTGELPSAPFKSSMERMKNSVSRTYDSYFTSASDMYEKTIGYINDDAVKMALDKSIQKDKMYTRNEQLGLLSDKTTADAAATSFMIADLYRFNVAPTAENPTAVEADAAAQYAAVMRRIAMNPTGAVAYDVDAQMPPAEFMIDRAADFYEDYVARQTLDPVAVPNFAQIRNDVRNARMVVAVNAAAEGRKPRRTLRRGGRKTGTEKQKTQDNYFEERDIRNDPQNVHETQVNNDMERIYRNVLHNNDNDFTYATEGPPDLAELRAYVSTYKFSDPKKKARALQTINKMAEGNWIAKLNARENEVLSNVWRRTGSSANEANRDSMRAALMDSLADCVETGYNGAEYQVCASGRTGRVLGSMTLLDADDAISQPIKTGEILRNEVFAKSYKIIQDSLKETDVETARGYNGELESPAPDVDYKVQEFEKHVRDRIANTLREDYPTVDSKILDNLISDAQAGV